MGWMLKGGEVEDEEDPLLKCPRGESKTEGEIGRKSRWRRSTLRRTFAGRELTLEWLGLRVGNTWTD